MGIDNTPTPMRAASSSYLAEVMEQVRSLLGDHPITINSGYRCYELNVACGGATNSAHTCMGWPATSSAPSSARRWISATRSSRTCRSWASTS